MHALLQYQTADRSRVTSGYLRWNDAFTALSTFL